MSSNTSILDDQTTDGSIDTEYFTALSAISSSSTDDISNNGNLFPSSSSGRSEDDSLHSRELQQSNALREDVHPQLAHSIGVNEGLDYSSITGTIGDLTNPNGTLSIYRNGDDDDVDLVNMSEADFLKEVTRRRNLRQAELAADEAPAAVNAPVVIIGKVITYGDDDLSRIISHLSSTKEHVLFNSATLLRIVSFLPSIDLPSLALTCKRFGIREEGELSLIELHDETLFKQPPPNEDCPICMQQMPTLDTGIVYMTCCGKLVCSGCYYAPIYDNQGNEVANKTCAFCRTPWYASDDEYIERVKKREEAGDAKAIHYLGNCYRNGTNGLSQDYTKALEQFHRAAELGYTGAYRRIAYAYYNGQCVEDDKKKARHYYELAAMGGDAVARFNLGIIEKKAGNMDRALKHYLIAVKDGHNNSLKQIRGLYKNGHVPKDEYTKALRLHQEYLDEIKSTRRDEAAAANNKYCYY